MIAPSKINLFLNVRAERADGYHELDTVFFPLHSPCDEIDMRFEGSGVRIECEHPGVPLDPSKNLCGKAVEAYCAAAKIPLFGCRIRIVKRIPCAGGMGGGSSDCAAVLTLLQERVHALTDEQMASVALSLGADVPFFLQKLPARASGVGECLTPLPSLPRTLPVLLAASDFPISAKWAYQHWTPQAALAEGAAEHLLDALASSNMKEAARFIGNSLGGPAFRKFPLLKMIRERFMESGALCAELSGSGPTAFALYETADAADAARGFLREVLPGVRVLHGF